MNVKYRKGPDGGSGWYVVLGSFFIHLVLDGILYSSGLFLTYFMDDFDAGPTIASMTITSMVGLSLLIGPLAAALVNAWGCRMVGMIGSAMAAIGLLATTFATNIYIVLLTFGFITGTGLGLLYVAAIIILPIYFSTKLARAVGISAAGSGIGTICFAPLVEYLIQIIGWRYTCTVLAGVVLTCIGFAWLFKPLMLKRVPIGSRIKKPLNNDVEKNNVNDNEPTATNDVNSSHITEDENGDDDVYETDVLTTCQIVSESFAVMTGPEVLRDFDFIVFSTSSFLVSIGYLVPYVYTKTRVLDLKIATELQASYLISIIGIGGTFGRLGYGLISDMTCVNRFTLYTVSTVLAGIIICLSVLIRNYWVYAAFCALFGLFTGGDITLTAVVITDLFQVHRVSNVFGLLSMFEGIATVLPIAGWIYERTLSLTGTFIFGGSFFILGGLILIIIPIHKNYIKNKE